jgi:hypothetical protein
MADATPIPRWELQLWSTAVKTSTGKVSTAEGKKAECLARFPLDQPIVVGGGWRRHTVSAWLTPEVHTVNKEADVRIATSYPFPVLTRDAQWKLIHTTDGTEIAVWDVPLQGADTLNPSLSTLIAPDIALSMSCMKERGKQLKLCVQSVVIGAQFRKHVAVSPIVQTMRAEYHAQELSRLSAITEMRRSSLKRARDELEEAEQAEKRMRESAP